MITSLDLSGIEPHISRQEMNAVIHKNSERITSVLTGKFTKPTQLGWFSPKNWFMRGEIEQILSLAKKIRAEADVFILIGVGGSNRGAQSLIECLGDRQIEIIYAGNNLSSQSLKDIMIRIKGKSVYINAIAKDFNTLEPGIHFRFLRQYLEKEYKEDARNRIVVTGSSGSGQLLELSKAHGYTYLPFPEDMTGRFSVLSAVGFLPMAVAGIDIEKLIQSAIEMEDKFQSTYIVDNAAVQYAVCRNLLFQKGFVIENMVTFEPSLAYFTRWWTQLFSESEGKNQNCIFPTASNFSEDLHAVGQYIQDGKRMVMETFINAHFSNPEINVEASIINDGFAYLDHKVFDVLNDAVYEAAYTAHKNGGVPCFQFQCQELNERTFGELFYFFMMSCCISASLIGVDPFGQGGVESYKRTMYQLLGK